MLGTRGAWGNDFDFAFIDCLYVLAKSGVSTAGSVHDGYQNKCST